MLCLGSATQKVILHPTLTRVNFYYLCFTQGRRFPKRARHRLVVEARFDGELLSTDPVEHVESPDFTQELAWELDKKSLYQHRLQRASIKIQVYAQDTQSTAREPVGYVVMDLRSAGNTQVLTTGYCRTVFIRQILTYKDGPRTEKI